MATCRPCKTRTRRFARDSRQYDRTFTVMRYSVTAGDVPADTDYSSLGELRCWLKPGGTKEVDFAGRQVPGITHMAGTPYSEFAWGVKSNDRLTLSDDIHGTRTFEIIGPPRDPDETHPGEIRFLLMETGR